MTNLMAEIAFVLIHIAAFAMILNDLLQMFRRMKNRDALVEHIKNKNASRYNKQKRFKFDDTDYHN